MTKTLTYMLKLYVTYILCKYAIFKYYTIMYPSVKRLQRIMSLLVFTKSAFTSLGGRGGI